MGAKTRQEATAPLGVIGSLTAGFELVGRNLGLIVWPVLLDLLLWLGPRLSIAPLFQRFLVFLATQPAPDVESARQIEQAIEVLKPFGEQFNVLSLLSALPLLNVPALLSRHAPEATSPLGEPRVLLVKSLLVLIAWVVALAPGGLLLGFLYLNSLARRVRALRTPEAPPQRNEEPTGQVIRPGGAVVKLINVFLFATGLLVVGMTLLPPWALLVGAVLASVPFLGFLVWSLGVGIGGYLVLHLLFVIPGVLVGERGLFRATVESFLLIQTQFPAVMGLILLTVVIYEGLGFLWSFPPGNSWTLLVGILGDSCIATGLTAATFVFYQERIEQIPKLRQTPPKAQ